MNETETKIEALDKKIDVIFSYICKNGEFKFGGDNDLYYSKNQSYIRIIHTQHGLISPRMGRDFELTELGRKVCRRGGWLKHLKFDEEIEKRRELKENFDFQTAKWKYYTFWLWFALAVFGGGYSTYDFIKRLTTKESDQQSQTHITKTESEESKSHISTSDHENPHSFQDSTTVVF